MVNRWHVCSLDSMSFEGIFDTKEKAMQQIELYKKSKVNNLILFKEAGRVSVIAANLKRVTFDSDSDFKEYIKNLERYYGSLQIRNINPSVTMPALIGRPMLRYAEKLEEIELKPIMIGDEVTKVRSLLELTYPMKEGIIEDKEDMGRLWDYCIRNKLGIEGDLKDRKILLTEAPNNPNDNKKKMGEIVFEQLGLGYFNIEPQAKLSLFCEGLETGIILDSGDGVTHCIPIAYGYIIHPKIIRMDIAGRHITDYLIKLLQVKGYAFNSTADFELV